MKKGSKSELYNSFGPILRFYTKNSPQNSWSPHFMITLWNQKSRNAGTSCTIFQKHLPMFSRLNAIFWQIGVTFFKVLFCTHPVACFYILLYSKTIQRDKTFFGKVNSIFFTCIFVGYYTDYNAKWRLNAIKLIYFEQKLAACCS